MELTAEDSTTTEAVPGTAHFEMRWPEATTPLEAIERALYAMADQVSGVTSQDGSDWRVTIHPRSASAHRERLEHQLRQEVTDHTLRVRIAERTDPIRNLVFAMAFSRSGLGSGADSSPPEAERP